jgi:ketosteroid isomerase-like protein
VSSGNVETVRATYEAFNHESRETMLEFLHPEIEWDESDLPARRPGVYRGHEGIISLLEENATLWENICIAIDDIAEGQDDRVIAFIRAKGRGRNTGVDVELASAQVWTIQDGKAVHVRLYLDREEALQAAGLEV